MPVLAGTSGWQYRDWRDVLYPAGVPQRAWLEHYAGRYPAHGAAVCGASAFGAIAGADNWHQDHAAGPVPDSG
jgi:hypothetical protein